MNIDLTYSYEVPEGWHLFYSETAAQQTGYVVYASADGVPVRVTHVAKTPELDSRVCKYDDVLYLGPAVRYLGREITGVHNGC